MILHGRNILLLAGGVAIAAAKSSEINVSADTIPIASPSSGQWEDAIAGRKSWKGSCSGLVTGITDPVSMIGTTVTLRMQVVGKYGMPFSGTVSNITITSGTAPGVTVVTWDSTNKQFVAVYANQQGTRYYTTWGALNNWASSSDYSNAAAGTLFHDQNGGVYNVYKKTATDLLPEALQGSAIVKDWKCTATIGNLAQGSMVFQGKGALSNPTT